MCVRSDYSLSVLTGMWNSLQTIPEPYSSGAGYRTECVSAPIIHCRCSAGMWNSLQTIPEPYSSGALSFRLRLLEADANNPST